MPVPVYISILVNSKKLFTPDREGLFHQASGKYNVAQKPSEVTQHFSGSDHNAVIVGLNIGQAGNLYLCVLLSCYLQAIPNLSFR